jgi:hypothetical protein
MFKVSVPQLIQKHHLCLLVGEDRLPESNLRLALLV